MFNFFSAVKLGYEVIAALLAVRAGSSYIWYPSFKGSNYKVTIEKLI